MAITLRNKPLEEKIRLIGRQRGLGPSAVIAKAVEALEQAPVQASALPSEEIARREKIFDEIIGRARAQLTDADRAAMKAIEDDMYDDFGLPK